MGDSGFDFVASRYLGGWGSRDDDSPPPSVTLALGNDSMHRVIRLT